MFCELEAAVEKQYFLKPVENVLQLAALINHLWLSVQLAADISPVDGRLSGYRKFQRGVRGFDKVQRARAVCRGMSCQ